MSRTGQKVQAAGGVGSGRSGGQIGQTVHGQAGTGHGTGWGRVTGQTVHIRGVAGCFLAEVTGWHYVWYSEAPPVEDPYHDTLEFCLGTSLEPVGVGHLAVAVDATTTIFDFGTIVPTPFEWPYPGDAPWQSVSDEYNLMSLTSTVWHLTGETVVTIGSDGYYDGEGNYVTWDIVQRGVTSAATPHAIGAEVRVSDNDTLGSIEDGGTTLTMPLSGTFTVHWYGYLYDPGANWIIENGEYPDWLGARFDLRLNGVTIDSAYDGWGGGEALHSSVHRTLFDVALEVGDKLQVWAYGDNAPNEFVYLTSSCSILIDGCNVY